jgi:GTPase SAR1 family protein
LFRNEDGRTFLPTARTIWESLLQSGTKIEETGTIDGGASSEIFEQLQHDAEKHGENLFRELHTKHQEGIHQEREKGRYAFHVRRQALNRIGLPEVRQFRIKKLDEEERDWNAALEQREHVFPELQPICILFVEACDG